MHYVRSWPVCMNTRATGKPPPAAMTQCCAWEAQPPCTSPAARPAPRRRLPRGSVLAPLPMARAALRARPHTRAWRAV
eukprot:366034-Chlamydomonas_euryale.AAC.5